MKNKEYLTTKPIAYVEGEALEVVDIMYGIEDKLVLRDRDNSKISKVKIYYNGERDFVRYNNRRIYLDNILRLQ